MERFKFLSKEKISKLPKTAGVYAFSDGKSFLYIGKAVNLKNRAKQHKAVLARSKHVAFIKTDSEIEALLLEAKLIKKYQPKYNTIWKDDKNYFYVAITQENYPRVFITHQTRRGPSSSKFKINYIGPFVEGRALKQALSVLRNIFPYYTQGKHPNGPCPWCHLNLCPGPNPDKKEYQKSIKNLISVLKGEKKSVLNDLKREMKNASKNEDFERAGRTRDQIAALEKISANAKALWPQKRIEAYDVSDIQGQDATGSMVTFINGKPDKNFYRKFRIKLTDKPNDVAMLKEVLIRRFKHSEWPMPNTILIDGGKPQLNVAVKLKTQSPKFKTIRIMSLAKKNNELYVEGRRKPVLLKTLSREIFNLILRLRDEAHRFAISYHKKLRVRSLLPK